MSVCFSMQIPRDCTKTPGVKDSFDLTKITSSFINNWNNLRVKIFVLQIRVKSVWKEWKISDSSRTLLL